MKTIVKIKFWPLIIVGLVGLFGTIVPFVNGIAHPLSNAVTEIVGALFPGLLTAEYTVAATLLGPLTPTAGSDAELILRTGLVVANITGVGLPIELPWLVNRRYSERCDTWICHACSAGKHQQYRGALLLVSRTREGARQCQCEHCALNR